MKQNIRLNKTNKMSMISGNSKSYELQHEGIGEVSQVALALLNKKAQGLLKGVLIPDSFIAEIDSFVNRNCVEGSPREVCLACPDCLKAHALIKANELDLDKRTIDYIDKIFAGKVGHDGYYLDEEELIKI